MCGCPWSARSAQRYYNLSKCVKPQACVANRIYMLGIASVMQRHTESVMANFVLKILSLPLNWNLGFGIPEHPPPQKKITFAL